MPGLTFLNLAFLIGLAAAAVPILIHLFSRRRSTRQEWASVKFLKELYSQRVRRVRLRQLFLLLVRVAAIVLFALAMMRPALEAGAWVLCDRYADSTRVYQGEAGVDRQMLDLLELAATAGLKPDLTILIDVPAEIGLKRVEARSYNPAGAAPDRFETDTLAVHERRRALFLELADSEPDRIAVVDGTGDAVTVETAIWQPVEARLGLAGHG